MLPSLPRLIARVIPRNELVKQNIGRLFPAPTRAPQAKVTTLDLLLKQKAQAGSTYPPNIRIEPRLEKPKLAKVPADIRDELKEYLKER